MSTPLTYALRLSDAERNRYDEMARHAREQELELWRSAGVRAGGRVADVGCGPAAVLAELASVVGPDGTVVGVEPNDVTRATARAELDARGLVGVDVAPGTGDATGLEPGQWDCVMMRHVLAHVGSGTQRIVDHLATLLAPGGHLYLVDTDTDGFCVSPPVPDVAEQLQRYADFHRHLGNDTRVGSRLESMMRGAGLDIVHARAISDRFDASVVGDGWPLLAVQEAMLASGQLQPDELPRFAKARVDFARRTDTSVWVPVYIAIGCRPS